MLKFNRIIKATVAVLLSLVLITSCLISGVFAKYVAKGNAEVGMVLKKWGLDITAKNTDLKKEYSETDGTVILKTNTTIGDDNIIAPGTKGVLGYFTVSGSAEVACNIKIDSEITLGSGYTDSSLLVCTDGTTLTEYFPIILKLCVTKNGTREVKEIWRMIVSGEDTGEKDRTLQSDILELITTLNEEMDAESSKNKFNESIAVNTTVNTTYSIEWEWFQAPIATATTYEGLQSFKHTSQTKEKDTALGLAILKDKDAFDIGLTMSITIVQSQPTQS